MTAFVLYKTSRTPYFSFMVAKWT